MKMNRFKILQLFILSTATLILHGQQTASKSKSIYYLATKSLIEELNELRNGHFHIIDSLIEVHHLEKDTLKFKGLKGLNTLVKDSIQHHYSYIDFIELFLKHTIKNSSFRKGLLAEYNKLDDINTILRLMLEKKLLRKKSTSEIDSTSILFDVLVKLDPQAHDTIIEIGAGVSISMMILYKMNRPLQLYANDIDDYLLDFLKNAVKRLTPSNSKTILITCVGSKTSTKLKKIQADKIFEINSLHHFEYANKMLEQIALSMKPSARFYIVEVVKQSEKLKGIIDDRGEDNCALALEEQEIYPLLKSNHFKIISIHEASVKTRIIETAYIK